MNALIILYSYHHNNTEKIAKVIATSFGAEIKTPEQVDLNGISNFDVVGFGSGVYMGKLGKPVLELADKLPAVKDKKAFIFSTSGRAGKNATKFHQSLREKLTSKGFTIAGEFNCGGFDTYGLLKIGGGIQKGRPNEDDLKQAETFAKNIQNNQSPI